jgi:hypothetical protein
MFTDVSPKFKITSKTSFNDLVFNRILFETADEGKRILESMFPSERVFVDIATSGAGFIAVGDVAIKVWSK